MTEGEDYYYDENGLLVFTEKFLLKRLVCCGNGCLHCPYEYSNVPEAYRAALIEAQRKMKQKDENKNG